jgi:hypothetical protein
VVTVHFRLSFRNSGIVRLKLKSGKEKINAACRDMLKIPLQAVSCEERVLNTARYVFLILLLFVMVFPPGFQVWPEQNNNSHYNCGRQEPETRQNSINDGHRIPPFIRIF